MFGRAKLTGLAKPRYHVDPPGVAGLPQWQVSCALTDDVAAPCHATDSDSDVAAAAPPSLTRRGEYIDPTWASFPLSPSLSSTSIPPHGASSAPNWRHRPPLATSISGSSWRSPSSFPGLGQGNDPLISFLHGGFEE